MTSAMYKRFGKMFSWLFESKNFGRQNYRENQSKGMGSQNCLFIFAFPPLEILKKMLLQFVLAKFGRVSLSKIFQGMWFQIFLFSMLSLFSAKAWGQYVPENNSKSDTLKVQASSKSNQEEGESSSGFDWGRVRSGGNLALNFGNPFFIDISPSVGYMVNEKLMLGLGVTYMAMGSSGADYSFYGGRLFGRQQIFESFFANAELEFLNAPFLNSNSNSEQRKWLVNPLLGASYVLPFGERGGIQASLLYSLNYQEGYSPYGSPYIWRIGVFF
jgi:hypothetical protein